MFRSLFLFLLSTLLLGSPAYAQQTVYRFSPVNQWDINKTAAYWNPIINYVSEKSGVKLELKIGRTSADTTAYVLAQEVEFVFSNHLFSPEREKLGWRVFGRRQPSEIKAVIVVPADSSIQTVADLKDKSIAFAGQEAFIGYKVPFAYLLSKDIKVNPMFGGNQNAAFQQMFSGRADAVGSNSALVDAYAAKEGKKFRVIWTSESYHDLALMASSNVKEADLKKVAKAFFQMTNDPAGKSILHEASVQVGMKQDGYFTPASQADFANYHRFYETAPVSLR